MLFLQNLKSHAVTMFEVGKLSDESLDSFLVELEKVSIHLGCLLRLIAKDGQTLAFLTVGFFSRQLSSRL